MNRDDFASLYRAVGRWANNHGVVMVSAAVKEYRLTAAIVQTAWVGDLHGLSTGLGVAGIVAELGPLVGLFDSSILWGGDGHGDKSRDDDDNGLGGKHI
ncbi:hypothetical protein AB5N19_01693 [Seiridium cardinale]